MMMSPRSRSVRIASAQPTLTQVCTPTFLSSLRQISAGWQPMPGGGHRHVEALINARHGAVFAVVSDLLRILPDGGDVFGRGLVAGQDDVRGDVPLGETQVVDLSVDGRRGCLASLICHNSLPPGKFDADGGAAPFFESGPAPRSNAAQGPPGDAYSAGDAVPVGAMGSNSTTSSPALIFASISLPLAMASLKAAAYSALSVRSGKESYAPQ